jgi:hypothetical protein
MATGNQSPGFGRPTPQIHDGMRTPRQHMRESKIAAKFYAKARGLYDERKAREAKLNPVEEDPYKVIFNSRFGSLRVQLSSPKIKTYEDGTKEVMKGLHAQFRQGTFRIPREIVCKRDAEDCKSPQHPACDAWEMLARLKRHKNFGIGKDFWLTVDAVDDGKVLKIAEVMQFLEKDEDGKSVVLDMMAESEFEAEALASSARPERPGPAPKPRSTASGYTPVSELPEAPVEIERELSPSPEEPADEAPEEEDDPLEEEPRESKRKGAKKRRPRRPGY